MYNDIEELIKEVEDFKENIKESGQLCSLLADAVEQMKKTDATINSGYELFTKEISQANSNIVTQSENVISKHIEVITENKKDFDARYGSFLNEISQTNNNIITQSESVIAKYLEVNKEQQDTFEKKTSDIINRLNRLDVESLLKEIKNVNLKIVILLGGVGLSIILGVISLLLAV